MVAILRRNLPAERRQAARPTIPEWPEYPPATQVSLVGKRAFDIAGSLVLLTLLSPLLVLLIFTIPLDSPGPVYFKNKRRGLYGRTFELLKFRTMHREAHDHREQLIQSRDPQRLLFKMKRDPRVTRFGRLLRKYSLDELPQLINVLRGEMSLIGPRPLLKEDFESTAAPGPLFRQWVRDRHRLRPGITGLWQVKGRNDLSLEDAMVLDLQYVTHWSPRLDLVIFFKTPVVVLAGKGAY
jgi:lipopolysaccharide/colanic/teichoic acid biosynthesis glycosyltransferase